MGGLTSIVTPDGVTSRDGVPDIAFVTIPNKLSDKILKEIEEYEREEDKG